jgi:hypothetical protein
LGTCWLTSLATKNSYPLFWLLTFFCLVNNSGWEYGCILMCWNKLKYRSKSHHIIKIISQNVGWWLNSTSFQSKLIIHRWLTLFFLEYILFTLSSTSEICWIKFNVSQKVEIKTHIGSQFHQDYEIKFDFHLWLKSILISQNTNLLTLSSTTTKCWMKLDCSFYQDKTLLDETHIGLHFINKWKSLKSNPMTHIHTIEKKFNNTFNDY